MNPNLTISLVIPAYNEEESIHGFFARASPIMESVGYDYEFVFIDDGSRDNTASILTDLAASHSNVRFIKLSRNFGKEAALTAGLQYATGDAVIPMDCDLQDPPELISQMVAKWKEVAMAVSAAVLRLQP